MKLAITAIVGLLAAFNCSFATDAAEKKYQQNDVQSELSGHDAPYSKLICDGPSATHVRVLKDGSIKQSIVCDSDRRKRDVSTPNTTAADALAYTLSDGPNGITLPTSPTTAHSNIVARDVSGYYVQLRWGGKMQHAGELGQGDLREKIKKILDDMCPAGGVGHKVCGDGSDDKNMQKIGDIRYEDKKGKWLSGDAHLQVRVPLAYWPAHFDGLREIFHDLIPDMFAISVQQDANCRSKEFKTHEHPSGETIQYCQIPEWVMVAIEHKAWMFVRINFNGDTSENYASCVFDKGLMNSYLNLETMKGRFDNKMRKPATLFTSCWDENAKLITPSN